jgi:hypothetical protein
LRGDTRAGSEPPRESAPRAPPPPARLEERPPVAQSAPARPAAESDTQAFGGAPAAAEGRAQAKLAPVAKPAPTLRAAPKPATRPAWLVELDSQPAERWLERLGEFRRDGRTTDADELLVEFRKRFPDHPASAR